MVLPVTQQGFVILVHRSVKPLDIYLCSELLDWIWIVLRYTLYNLLFQCLERKSTSGNLMY